MTAGFFYGLGLSPIARCALESGVDQERVAYLLAPWVIRLQIKVAPDQAFSSLVRWT
jgi:hypothetical protein